MRGRDRHACRPSIDRGLVGDDGIEPPTFSV
jgi:hypothetical protein